MCCFKINTTNCCVIYTDYFFTIVAECLHSPFFLKFPKAQLDLMDELFAPRVGGIKPTKEAAREVKLNPEVYAEQLSQGKWSPNEWNASTRKKRDGTPYIYLKEKWRTENAGWNPFGTMKSNPDKFTQWRQANTIKRQYKAPSTYLWQTKPLEAGQQQMIYDSETASIAQQLAEKKREQFMGGESLFITYTDAQGKVHKIRNPKVTKDMLNRLPAHYWTRRYLQTVFGDGVKISSAASYAIHMLGPTAPDSFKNWWVRKFPGETSVRKDHVLLFLRDLGGGDQVIGEPSVSVKRKLDKLVASEYYERQRPLKKLKPVDPEVAQAVLNRREYYEKIAKSKRDQNLAALKNDYTKNWAQYAQAGFEAATAKKSKPKSFGEGMNVEQPGTS